MRRIIDVLWITRGEGEEWPRGYGVAWRSMWSDGLSRGTIIPFNLLLGWLRWFYGQTRFGWAPPPTWQDHQNAYLHGREAGYEAGVDSQARAAFDEAWKSGMIPDPLAEDANFDPSCG